MFKLTEEEERKWNESVDEINGWIEEKRKEYSSEFNLKDGSCSSKLLEIILSSFHDDYIWPGLIYATCKDHGVEEIRNSLDFFERKGLVKIEKASDVLKEGLNERLDFGPLDHLKQLNKIAKQELNFETDEIIIPTVRHNI